MAGTQATCQDIVRQARKIISRCAAGWPRRVGKPDSQLMLADKTLSQGSHVPDTHGRSV